MMSSFILGCGAGWVHFKGLQLTVARLSTSRRPNLLIRGSFALRSLFSLLLLALFCSQTISALLGWWCVRNAMVSRWS